MAVNNQWWLSVSLVLLLSACGGDKEDNAEEAGKNTSGSPDTEEPVDALPDSGNDDPLLDETPVIDSAIPTVTGLLIDGELYGSGTIRNANVRFVGTASPSHSLEFTLNGDFLGTGMAREDGTWVLDNQGMSLTEGGHSLQVTAVDKDGVRTDASSPFEFAYVPEAMDPPVILAVDPDTGLSDVDGITTATAVASYGTATPNLPVHVYRDGELIGITEADENGHWSLTPEETPLADGLYHLSADTVYDDIRSAISVLFPLQVDTGVSVPTLALLNATGAENHTADAGLMLGGGSEPGSLLSLYQGDTLVDTVVTADDGSWELDLSDNPRPDGDYSFRANAMDRAGNESGLSPSHAVRVDTEPPLAPLITGISEDADLINTGGLTSGINLYFHGTAEPQSRVAVTLNGTALGETVTDSNGDWLYDHSSLTLEEGSHELTATAADKAGNRSPSSDPFTLLVDLTAPGTPTDLAISPETGPQGSGLTGASQLVFSGRADALSTVEVWLDADSLGVVLTDGNGNWSLDHTANTLTQGSYSLTARATDVAGNTSVVSDALAVTVDSLAPAAPNVTGITDDAGRSNSDGITSDTNLWFHGTADAASTVTVSMDGVELGSTLTDVNGDWSYDHSANSLNDGAYTVTAVARDAAGNDSALSNAFAVTVDTVAPGLTGTVPAHNATNVALDSTLTLSLDETVWPLSGELSLHRVSDDSLVEAIPMNSDQVTGGGSDTLTVTPSAALAGGTSYYVLVDGAVLQDIAGNAFSGITGSATWQFSTEATALVSSTPAHNATGVASDTTLVMQFSETVSAGSGDLRIRRGSDDTVFQTISITSGAVVFSGDTATVTPPDLLGSARDYYIELDSGAVVNSAGADFAGFSGDTHWRFTVVEGEPVTVLNVTSAVANDTYDSGALIPIQVVFSEPVDLSGGTPGLTLALDEGPRTVAYVSGSGTDTLVFHYSVVSGDTSAALDVAGTSALNLNGATLRSATLVDADLTLPVPGQTGSLSVNKSLVIQATSLIVSNLGDNGYLVNTAAGNSALGSSVAGVGDINGSGFEDFALGAPGAGNGTVYVIYGSAVGLPADIQIAADGSIDPALGFRILGASASDRLGDAVGGAGDFNGDSIDDLYMTAPGAAMGGTERGAVYIVWGQQGATRADVNLGGWVAAVGETNSDGVVIAGTEDGQRLGEGSALATANGQVVASGGDFNGDGVLDLVLGHPGSDLSGTDAGRAWVLFGKRQASRANIDLLSPGMNGRIIDPGNQPGAAFGQGLGFIGDFNGNGHDDLALGAPGASAFAAQAGQVHVLFGSTASSGFALSTLDGTNGFTLSVNQAGALLGHALAGGDFNGNGRSDLLLGAPGISRAWVVYGKDSASFSDVLVDSLVSTDGFAIVSETGSDGLGQALASAGDFNGNGLEDLLLGAWQSDANGTGSGAAWLIPGRSGTPGTLDLSVLNTSEGFAVLGGSASDGFGRSLASGDFNGDGLRDLLAGAPASDHGATGAGQVAVVHGTAYGSTILAGTTGTTGGENILGSAGDDLLSGGGGTDALSGGAGSDLLGIGDLNFRKIRGGRGSVLAAMDALLLETSGTTLDLLSLTPEAIHDVELIDLGDAGNTLNLDRLRLLRLSRTTPRLVVSGGGSDSVTVASSDLWLDSGSEVIGSDTYNLYLSGGAELLVQSLLGQNGIVTFAGSQQYHVNTTGVIAGHVDNFPLLLRITDSAIIQAVEPGAPDIRLLDADGHTALDYEILRWDQTNNLAELWVRVPRIYGETDGAVSADCEAAGVSSGQCNTVTLVYDNATAEDGQSPASLWEGYAGVWHLNEAAATAEAMDSTGFGNHASLVNGDGSSVDAIIGKGRIFSSDNAMQVPFDVASMSTAENKAFTLSAWIREPDLTDSCFNSLNRRVSRPMAYWGPDTSNWNWRLMSSERSYNCLTVNKARFFIGNDGTFTSGTSLGGGSFSADPGWVLFTVTHDGTDTWFYRHNEPAESTGNTLVMEDNKPLTFGAANMIYDSVRLARFAMSADEVNLMHANQIPGSTLVAPAP